MMTLDDLVDLCFFIYHSIVTLLRQPPEYHPALLDAGRNLFEPRSLKEISQHFLLPAITLDHLHQRGHLLRCEQEFIRAAQCLCIQPVVMRITIVAHSYQIQLFQPGKVMRYGWRSQLEELRQCLYTSLSIGKYAQ